MLQRMRELSVQAANDSLTYQDRSYLQNEIEELCGSINLQATNASFNGKRLLDGTSAAQWSSDSAATKLRVTGAITVTDNYGQKRATEGNYRIEVKAQPGQGHVQKSNIIELDTVSDTPITETAPLRDKDGNIITDSNGDPIEKEVVVKEKKLHPAKLEELKSFKTASGVSFFTEPQRIRITQGDGRTADIYVNGGDTVYDVRRKINDAIADDLEQAQYTDNRENFCTISDGTEGTSESVLSYEDATSYLRNDDGKLILDEYGFPQETTGDIQIRKGTILVRSAIAGEAGRLTFSSENEDLINALGLSTIQEPKENLFMASVYDAHTNKVLAKDVPTAGNVITGVIHPNAEIEFDNMANVKATWDEGSKRYVLTSEADAYTTTLHVKDRSTAFQIGQGRGEDIYINIGDMRAEALGITGVDVTTRENASKSIAILDSALHKVNSQRSRLGTYMNELEYNTNSLTNTNLHMQESESRIKDADMALEYMDFVKLQILSQAGNSMLAQAN